MTTQPSLPFEGAAAPDAPKAEPSLAEGMAWFAKSDGTRQQGRPRCVVEGPRLQPCLPLETVLGWFDYEANTRLAIERGMQLHGNAEGHMLVLVRDRKRHATFKFCPFCGAPVETVFAVPGEAR